MKAKVIYWSILCLLCSVLISSFYFKGLFLDPENHTTTFGGDGLTIHYNLQYHATYGEGTHLKAQYYPHGETIFMTAAQGLLATTLASLRSLFPGIGNHAVTISNLLTYGSNILSVIILFLCFLKLKVRPSLSTIFAILITFLAPQIYRQTCGHYSLSYSFFIPAIIYYLLHRRFCKGFIFLSVLIAAMLVCLGLNDPYLLAIGASLILGSCLVGLLAYKLKKGYDLKVLVSWGLVAIVSLGMTMGVLETLDSVADRSHVQFGFFVNISSFKGLLYPNHTWLSKLVSSKFEVVANSFESHCYLGLIPILFSLLLVPFLLTKQRHLITSVFKNSNLLLILGGGILVLLFSFSFPFSMAKEFSTEHFSKILQFRAPGRFSWVFYYSICIAAVKFISVVFNRTLAKGKKGLAYLSLLLIILFWGYEVHEFMSWRTAGNIHHNAFSQKELKKPRRVTKDLRLNNDNYHGLFLLPTEHGWTDKVYHEGSWRSNYEGYRYSIASGLPLINGKLSRMSVGHALDAMQLVSNPIIPRKYLDQLSESKDILILRAIEEKLSVGEQWIADLGEEIYKDKYISLHRLQVKNIKEQGKAMLEKAQVMDSTITYPIVYEHYEENQKVAFAGTGCKLVHANDGIFSIPISGEQRSKKLNLSFWYYVDITKEGAPFFFLRCKDENGKIINQQRRWALNILDTHKGWLRAEMELEIPKNTSELDLVSEYKSDFYIDELLLKNTGDDIYFQEGTKIYYNNFLVKE